METPRPSITDFLTDGALAALCDALSAMTGARVTLHDAQGRRILHTGAEPPWRVEPADHDSAALAARLHQPGAGADPLAPDSDDPTLLQPLRVGGVLVGAIVVSHNGRHHDHPPNPQLRQIVRLLASTVDELCETDSQLSRRNDELDILFRLSSLLVTSKDMDAVLDAALRSASELLAFDAGAVHLLDDEGHSLTLRASLGLSPADAVRLKTLDSSADNPAQTSVELDGFRFVVACDLRFNSRRLGVLRLFTREPALLAPPELALLQTIAEQVAAAVASARLIESERHGQQVQRQLRLAADVQRRMLPASPPSIPGLDIAARYLPSLELGGDFYDLIDLGGHLGVAVGDVAGKGAPAAMLMASVRATLRAHAPEVYHLDEVITRVNKALTRDTLPNEFATLFYGVINPETLRLTYCSAGHDPTYLLRIPHSGLPTTADLHRLDTGGTVIGIDASQSYERGMFDMRPGDTLVAYTDGVVDARNFEQHRFGRPHLQQAIVDAVASDPACSAQKVADHIIWEVRRFIGLNPPSDDITVVVVRVTTLPGPRESKKDR